LIFVTKFLRILQEHSCPFKCQWYDADVACRGENFQQNGVLHFVFRFATNCQKNCV